jgi:hypothetical protein
MNALVGVVAMERSTNENATNNNSDDVDNDDMKKNCVYLGSWSAKRLDDRSVIAFWFSFHSIIIK